MNASNVIRERETPDKDPTSNHIYYYFVDSIALEKERRRQCEIFVLLITTVGKKRRQQ